MEQTQQPVQPVQPTQPQYSLPTEEVTLPSKGLLYPEGSPLRSGKITMKYMTAKEEDILTNQNYIKNGTVIDKLLQSLIVDMTKVEDLLIGDAFLLIFLSPFNSCSINFSSACVKSLNVISNFDVGNSNSNSF